MFRWTQSITAKVLGIGALALIMLIPLTQADGLVRERQAMREAASVRVAEGWGGPQTIGGLVVAVPTRHEIAGSDGRIASVRDGTEIVLADQQSTVADLTVERRHVGIYEVPVYTGDVTLRGRILPDDLRRFAADTGSTWAMGKAELRLLVADTRGVQDITSVTVDGRPVRFASSAARMGPYTVLSAPLPIDAGRTTPIDFAATLRIAGTESFSALPLARTNSVRIRSAWPDPGFTGALLPAKRSVTKEGFDAAWQVLDLNRDYGQHWDAANTEVAGRLASSTFGVKLHQPGGVYQQNDRAGKYGLLFIALTFVAFFLFEILKGLRLHPVQYLLVGAAMTSFYVLLLALSEQIGFGAAYAVAASTVVLIVGGYATAALRARGAGLCLGGVLALVYVILYGLIGAEQYALLIGSVVLVTVIALLMYLTRRIDWYAYGTPPLPSTESP
ncbi:cell envelope integrity protein CreD [Luteibacter sp. 3190]|uniref:cell envelope integrity protein CreD n=1 Tax=Luteibacter sp. 3190 TaxID=2817736 RepID=UPI0028678104|nr:cell envelope integrity protein CreD [Luteibacter sp. 3190]MDR6936720.1 inner membrane protein [Luteibacter sp. 3190]